MERDFSQTMLLLRKKKGLSQRTVAADLRISQALLSHYENSAREPGLDFVRRACTYYGVSADYLLGLVDENGRSAERRMLYEVLTELDALRGKIRDTLGGTDE